MIERMQTFKLPQLFRAHPKVFLPMLLFNDLPKKSAREMEDLFKPQFSLPQSSRWVMEEEVAFFWITILGEIEEVGGVLVVPPDNATDDKAMCISFEDILIFSLVLQIFLQWDSHLCQLSNLAATFAFQLHPHVGTY